MKVTRVQAEAINRLEQGHSIVPVYAQAWNDMEKAPAGKHPDKTPITSKNPITPGETKKENVQKVLDAFTNRKWGLGIICGTNNTIVMDADTVMDIMVLRELWKRLFNQDLPQPTVKTPGTYKGHNNGGHWHIYVKDGIPEEWPRKLIIGGDQLGLNTDAHADIMIKGVLVIIPPTERKKGPYEHHGEITEITQSQLHDFIMNPPLSREQELTRQAAERKRKEISERRAKLRELGVETKDPLELIHEWEQTVDWWDYLDGNPDFEFTYNQGASSTVWSYKDSDSDRCIITTEGEPLAYVPSETLRIHFITNGAMKQGQEVISIWNYFVHMIHKGNRIDAFRDAGINCRVRHGYDSNYRRDPEPVNVQEFIKDFKPEHSSAEVKENKKTPTEIFNERYRSNNNA